MVRIGKKDYLFFIGTSYLGMEEDAHYGAVLQDCIRQYGANHGLSRVNNVRLKVFEEFEKFFAKNAKVVCLSIDNTVQPNIWKSSVCCVGLDNFFTLLQKVSKVDGYCKRKN